MLGCLYVQVLKLMECYGVYMFKYWNSWNVRVFICSSIKIHEIKYSFLLL